MNAEQRWHSRINAWRDSGQSVKVFCKEQGIIPSHFYSWKAKLKKSASSAPEPSNPLPMVQLVTTSSPIEPSSVKSSEPIVIEHGSLRILLPMPVSKEMLNTLLDVLARRP